MKSYRICPFVFASFIQHNVFKFIHFVACIIIYFLRPSNIPLYRYAMFCSSIHLLMDTGVSFEDFLLSKSFSDFYKLCIWFGLKDSDQPFSSLLSLSDMITTPDRMKASHRGVKPHTGQVSVLTEHNFC